MSTIPAGKAFGLVLSALFFVASSARAEWLDFKDPFASNYESMVFNVGIVSYSDFAVANSLVTGPQGSDGLHHDDYFYTGHWLGGQDWPSYGMVGWRGPLDTFVGFSLTYYINDGSLWWDGADISYFDINALTIGGHHIGDGWDLAAQDADTLWFTASDMESLLDVNGYLWIDGNFVAPSELFAKSYFDPSAGGYSFSYELTFWGIEASDGGTPVTPEPASLLMMGIGLAAGVPFLRRRKLSTT